MLTITDPANNYAFEVHQYLDPTHGGTGDTCSTPTIGVDRITEFTAWCRANGRLGFLGEFAGGANDTCYLALDNMLAYMQTNSDVWLGWTYWAAGPWWYDYMFTIEPQNFITGSCSVPASPRPQMAVLQKYLPVPKHYCTIQTTDQLQVRALDGYSYQLESSANLAPGSWQASGEPFTGIGLLTNLSAGPATNTQQFYRIRIDRSP